MRTLHRQQGLTLSGLLMGGALVLFVALTAMKLFPLYNELFKVKAAMKAIVNQPGIESKSTVEIHRLLMRNFEVSDVETFTDANIRHAAKVQRIKNSPNRVLTFQYEKRGPLFGSLDVVLKIDERIEVPGAGT